MCLLRTSISHTAAPCLKLWQKKKLTCWLLASPQALPHGSDSLRLFAPERPWLDDAKVLTTVYCFKKFFPVDQYVLTTLLLVL